MAWFGLHVPSSAKGGIVTIGNFDGVHRGHAELISELKRMSQTVGGPAVVVTFDPPPVAILVPDRPPSLPLTSIKRRAELLGSLGVDALMAIPTMVSTLILAPKVITEAKAYFKKMASK